MKRQIAMLLFVGMFFFGVHSLKAGTSSDGRQAVGNAQVISGFPAPEDIDVMPDGKHLLLSPFGGIDGENPQSLYLFDPQTLKAAPIAFLRQVSPVRWDDNECKSAPGDKFGSHGIDIAKRPDGLWQVLAVNHVRESVEMFEIVEQDGKPALAWRGCVVTPPKSSINDVTALPGGGFLVTHMAERGTVGFTEAMSIKGNTGHVWRWLPGKGLDKLPGSDASLPNGVAVSPDGRFVYIAETSAGRVRKIDYHTGRELGSAPATAADNFSWSPDGRLLITGINGPIPEGCMESPGPCLAPFQVQAIDPDTMEATVLLQQNGPPMGAGTIAVLLGNYLYVGSFKGDRMMRVRLPEQNKD